MHCTLGGFVCDLQRFELTLQDAETKLGRWLSSCDCREVCLAIKIVVSCVAVYCPSCPNQHLHSGCGFAGVPPEPVAAKDSRQREREREGESEIIRWRFRIDQVEMGVCREVVAWLVLHACVNHGCPRLERSLPEALPRGRQDENSSLALRLPGSRCVADLRDGVAARNNVQVGYSLVAVNGKDIKNLTSDTFKLGAEQLKTR